MHNSTNPTKAPAHNGIGWSSGMAAKLSLPNMLLPRPLGCTRTDFVDRPRPWRQCQCNDLLEQIGFHVLVSEGRHAQRLLREFGVTLRCQRRSTALASLIHPAAELI